MNVRRTNPSLRGLGCSCDDATFGSGMSGVGDLVAGAFPVPMNPITAGRLAGLRGLGRLGMDTYSDMSWHPPSQSSPGGYFGNGGGDFAVQNAGTAANALLNASPDGPTPIGTAVVSAFSNDTGGAQPGVLPLYPNATADGLSFVRTPPPSLQCQLITGINSNPIIFLGAVFGIFYLANMGSHKVREYHARKKAAKGTV